MAGHPFEQVLAALNAEQVRYLWAWKRAVRVSLDTTTATVASLEDLVALKRAAGRPIDLADVAALEAIAAEGSGAP